MFVYPKINFLIAKLQLKTLSKEVCNYIFGKYIYTMNNNLHCLVQEWAYSHFWSSPLLVAQSSIYLHKTSRW